MSGDRELISDDMDHEVADLLRATYVSTDLPDVGAELAAAFRSGLSDVQATPSASPSPGSDGRRRFETAILRRRGVRLALAGAALSVSLMGVGSAGLLPGPAQTVFEKTTESVGIEVPAATRSGQVKTPAIAGDPAADQPAGSTAGHPSPSPMTTPHGEQRQPDVGPGPNDTEVNSRPTPSTTRRSGDRPITTVTTLGPADPRTQDCVAPPGGPRLPPPTHVPRPRVPTSLPPPDIRLPVPPPALPPVVPGCTPPTTSTTTTIGPPAR